jgi:hypothetical protein
MIGSATKRTTLRAIHLVLSIPILVTFMVSLRKFNSTQVLLGLSSFL